MFVTVSRVSLLRAYRSVNPIAVVMQEVLSHAKPLFLVGSSLRIVPWPSDAFGGDANSIARAAASRWSAVAFGALVGVQAAETNQAVDLL